MNTEVINTLKQIREGIGFFQVKLNDQTLKSEEKELVVSAIIELNRTEDVLINNALQDLVDKVNSSNEDLKNLIENMNRSTEKIANFSNTVKKISDTVSVLAEITAKAISVGII